MKNEVLVGGTRNWFLGEVESPYKEARAEAVMSLAHNRCSPTSTRMGCVRLFTETE